MFIFTKSDRREDMGDVSWPRQAGRQSRKSHEFLLEWKIRKTAEYRDIAENHENCKSEKKEEVLEINQHLIFPG